MSKVIIQVVANSFPIFSRTTFSRPMTSGRKPLSTAAVLGILGSAGGLVNFITFAIAFALFSFSSRIANAPLFTPEEDLVLLGLGGSSVMGMVGAFVSIRYPGRGGAVMVWSACIAILTLAIFYYSVGFFALYGLDFSWWAMVLLFGGIFGLRTKMARQDGRGTSVSNTGASQTL
ncbi:hypothetical protein AUF78_08225 [archaeon 13_1_20CM_2_51_12]|nr:MAG: hypothetical protein AUI97_08825 [Crenarchaeota archaeon 13_1_40CM_3_52_17]OLE70059.1 MAG: hypothetical protein AUF78_08225 [archaeon 13_1_20CM_2_51_12]